MDDEDESHEAGLTVGVDSLAKRYGELVAMDDLSLTILYGQVLGLLSPNGSSRTTTISYILQLLIYDKGSIRVFGEPMTPTSYGLKHCIGVVPQSVVVFDELTVTENVNAFCALYVHDRAEEHRLVAEVIAFVGLEKFVRFKLRKLSGGLLRRLNIACGIARGPDLIFLDEPTVTIDSQGRGAVPGGIKCLSEHDATVIYTSHCMEETEQLCDRVVIMNRDQQVASGTSDEFRAMIGTGERIRMEVVNPAPLGEEALEGLYHLEHVRAAAYQDDEALIECSPGAHNLTDVVRTLDAVGATYGQVTSEPPTLNNIFLEIIGRTL